MRPKTQNAGPYRGIGHHAGAVGAALERQAIRSWAKRAPVTTEVLLAFLAGRTSRDDAKQGGLGKKSKP